MLTLLKQGSGIRVLDKNTKFRCRECQLTKTGYFFISPTLCKKCAARRRTSQTSRSELVVLQSENGETVTLTTVIKKRLEKQADTELPLGLMDQIQVVVVLLALAGSAATLFTYFFLFDYVRISGWLFWAIIGSGFLFVWVLGAPRRRALKAMTVQLALKREANLHETNKFYSSPEWKRVRSEVIATQAGVCDICKSRPKGADLTVDHIKPRSKFPELALKSENLRILCRSCNSSKGNRPDKSTSLFAAIK